MYRTRSTAPSRFLRASLLLAFSVQAVLFLWLLAWTSSAQSSSAQSSSAQEAVPASARTAPSAPVAMPRAVSSFGAAELDGWIYLLGGHAGRTHRYTAESQWDGFVRVRADDPGTREELPGGERVQGTALVAAGGKILSIGGMRAEGNGDETRLVSLASVRAFDPATKSWSELPALSEPRSSHDAAVHGSRVYVFGGWNMQGDSDDAGWLAHGLVLDLDDLAAGWRALAQPRAQRGIAAAACADELFVLGGMDAEDEFSSAVDVFTPATGAWREAPDFPEPGFGLAAAVLGDRLLASGRTGKVFELAPGAKEWRECGRLLVPRLFHRMVAGRRMVAGSRIGAATDELVVLGGSSDSRPVGWIERVRPDAPAAAALLTLPFAGGARQRQALAVRGSELHLFGGNVALEQHAFEPEDFLAESWRVELGSGAVGALPPLPRARQSMVCVNTPDKKAVLALGGFGHDGERDRAFDEVWRCELESAVWETLDARLPRPMTQFRALVRGDELLLAGGMDFDRERDEEMQLLDMVYTADLAHLEHGFHDSGLRLTAPRRAFGAVLAGERLYVVGGLDASFTAVPSFEVHDFATGKWSTLPAPATARVSPELVELDGKLYLCAGLTFDAERRTRPVELVEEFDPARGTWRTIPTPLPLDPREVQAFAWHGRLAVVSTWNERGVLEVALLDPQADAGKD